MSFPLRRDAGPDPRSVLGRTSGYTVRNTWWYALLGFRNSTTANDVGVATHALAILTPGRPVICGATSRDLPGSTVTTMLALMIFPPQHHSTVRAPCSRGSGVTRAPLP